MQCPHCHNELPQGASMKFCPYCAKPLQADVQSNTQINTLNDDLNRRSHPKWRETEHLCGFLSALIAALFFLCFFLPFMDLGLLGSFSGYEFIAEEWGSWLQDPGAKEFALYIITLIPFAMWVGILFSGLSFGLSKSKKKYGCLKNTILSWGVLAIIASAVLFIWVYKWMDGYTSAIGVGAYFLLVLAVCELIVSIYSRYVYDHLPVPSATDLPQPQQEGSPISTPEGTALYDVVLTYMPMYSGMGLIKDKAFSEVIEMLGGSVTNLALRDQTADVCTLLGSAMKPPPVQIATAVGEPYAKLLSDKLREIGATAEIRPHTTM